VLTPSQHIPSGRWPQQLTNQVNTHKKDSGTTGTPSIFLARRRHSSNRNKQEQIVKKKNVERKKKMHQQSFGVIDATRMPDVVVVVCASSLYNNKA